MREGLCISDEAHPQQSLNLEHCPDQSPEQGESGTAQPTLKIPNPLSSKKLATMSAAAHRD
jgi:hypothetical protein